ARRAELLAALGKRPPDGGGWTGPKVARYVHDRWGVRVCPQTGWGWLRGVGFTLQVPRPAHPRGGGPATPRRGGKNWSAGGARAGRLVEVGAEDEARLGLKPIARRVWSPRGRRPRSGGRTRYDWLYVYAFARPKTGQTFTAILRRVNAGRMSDALAAFAAE